MSYIALRCASLTTSAYEKENDFKDKFEINTKSNEDLVKSELRKEENKHIENFESTYLSFLDQQLIDKGYDLSITFPNYFRHFFLTQLYSFVESELRLICIYHHTKRNTDYSIKDLYGTSDLEKAKK